MVALFFLKAITKTKTFSFFSFLDAFTSLEAGDGRLSFFFDLCDEKAVKMVALLKDTTTLKPFAFHLL